ncbi:MAG: SDR family NAD(P)-dependent oxidoreductase [Longimicrobiales bacterium]
MAQRTEARDVASTPVLAGRRAVVTGASSGIGRAIALAFAEAGADVVVTYHRSAAAAESVAAEACGHGVAASTIQADLAESRDIDRLVEQSFERLGGIDIWVNNAGQDILTGGGARLPAREQLDRLIAVDLRGTVLCCWQVAERMRSGGGGVILNMSWDRALNGSRGREAELFSAVKSGVQGFSRSLALTVAPTVRVNVLAPGWIATAFAAAMSDEERRRIAARTPLGRWGEPEDVARAALFLASPAAAFLTGVVLPINGGAA